MGPFTFKCTINLSDSDIESFNDLCIPSNAILRCRKANHATSRNNVFYTFRVC